MGMNPDRKRHFAEQRALKLSILFKENAYDDIMDALNSPSGTPDPAGCHADRREHDFYAACPGALTPEEKDWLWNYLQHCTTVGKGRWNHPGVRDAASVGW